MRLYTHTHTHTSAALTRSRVPANFEFVGRAEAHVARQLSGVVLTFATLLPNAT